MKKMTGYCGLDCEKCDAYIATVNDDQALREKTAKLCLFMKRPWDESWFTWPITDQDPFFVSGDTFLTEVD